MLTKDITFIYSDSAEKAIYQPLAEEAKKRGYKVKLTDNPFEKCEIGFYCQHINHPQYSKFSLVMLHDIIQQYGNWPDIWFFEPWNKFDIGIIPSDQWEINWKAASTSFYAVPKKGMYKVGWPKADTIIKLKDPNYRKEFYTKHQLDPNKKTVLYAPAWENDNKQDDFVKSMQNLNVNIIIKQWDADPEKYPNQVENVQKMKELHKDIPWVTILPPETNIFYAIAASDILVSEESSTMCEATMMGIPAISVSDWLIPDTTPSRFPKCDYNFVYTTLKANLSKTVQEIISSYPAYKSKTEDFCKKNFANIGNSSSMIMDIIDDCVAEKRIRYTAIEPSAKKRVPLKKYLNHKYEQLRRECFSNYSVQSKAFRVIWDIIRRIKHHGK
ncbi:MAG: hypothetical protein IKS96_12035 [Fibrobacter sp.]|nr:hypothetical protein [Fibrobacter sp.]